MSTPFSYFDLIEAFERPGCPVCNLLLRDAARFLDSLLYEFANDRTIQGNFRASRGLCNEHGWQLMQQRGGVLSITVLYEAALDEILATIEGSPNDRGNSKWLTRLLGAGSEANAGALADHLEPTRPCPACALLAGSERFYVETMGQYVTDPRFGEAFRNSDGLCLPHFRSTLRKTRVRANLEHIITTQTAIWEKLQADLEVLKDKYDINRGEFALGDAGDSWQRAIRSIAGEQGVFGLNRR